MVTGTLHELARADMLAAQIAYTLLPANNMSARVAVRIGLLGILAAVDPIAGQSSYPSYLPGMTTSVVYSYVDSLAAGWNAGGNCSQYSSLMSASAVSQTCYFGAATTDPYNVARNIGSLTTTGMASVSGSTLRARTTMTGTLNRGYYLIADAGASYQDRVMLSGGSGATTVRFDWSLHGTASGFSSPGGSTNQSCTNGFLAGRLDFVGWNTVNPDGSPAQGTGQSSPCHTGDGTTTMGSFSVPITHFTNGALAYQLTLVAFGRYITNDPAYPSSALNYVSDFSNSAQLTALHVFDAAGTDITGSYNVSFGGAGIAAVVTATPEPASILLVASGLIGVAFSARRRRF